MLFIDIYKADEKFVKKLTKIIHQNIENSDFNVDKLSEELCMSRSSLLRKIKGISELMPNDFIRITRLKRAAEILSEGKYKVNEVCYMVGFQSNSHFSKAFQKQFGVLPKNFTKKSIKFGEII
ncbi:MAG: AraC family transcriptional regulator [Dysgonamonadaceae bacterium]|jgi:AraC-like DNA-binding protein|nr:AraC family transcriptional regulator [Dysgonamonadaceae bacterium]